MDEYLNGEGNVILTEGKLDTKTKRVFKPIAYLGDYTIYEEYVVDLPVVVSKTVES